jgi:uncharacterized protein (DUF1684 family)
MISRQRLVPMLVVGLVVALEAAVPAPPVKLTGAAADAVIKEIHKDRTDTMNWLRSEPTSYLATIDRKNFEEKSALSVGRAKDNDVRIDSPDVSAHHVRVTVVGDRFRVEGLDASARFTVKDKVMREALLDPSYIQIGRFTVRLSHQRYPALIVFDPKSSRFKDYKGIRYFDIDLSYRYELPLTPNPKPETVTILSTVGNQRSARRIGWFDFTVNGKAYRLEAMRLLEPGVGENDVSVFFRDATSGKDSYALGRYVDPKKLPNGNYVLDFNMAYNPACAFSDHYNCPIPPKTNTLPVAIWAGEMDSHYH